MARLRKAGKTWERINGTRAEVFPCDGLEARGEGVGWGVWLQPRDGLGVPGGRQRAGVQLAGGAREAPRSTIDARAIVARGRGPCRCESLAGGIGSRP